MPKAQRDSSPADAVPAALRLPPALDRISGEVSLRRLQAFWAVAHTASMTKAAKLLGVSQPSLSQQLAGFEAAVGARLFERRPGGLELTELGAAVLGKAEQVLRSVRELEDGLPGLGGVAHCTLRVGGAGSVMRTLLPAAIRRIDLPGSRIEYDLHEGAPGEVLDMLYARRINLGLVAAGSIAEIAKGFRQVPVLEDPYVLAVPAALDLDGLDDPERLAPAAREVLNGTLQFVFGTHHSRRIQDWYDRVLPRNRLVARVRTFETMIEMTRAGLGVCIVPALSLSEGGTGTAGLRLYAAGLGRRQVVALCPTHYHSVRHYDALIAALVAAGPGIRLPEVRPMPPFLARAAGEGADSR